jgi:hypothetical protein
VSTDPKFDRHFDKLTSDYVLAKLEFIDAQLEDPKNSRRMTFLYEQRAFWESQLPRCQKREGAMQWKSADSLTHG